MEGIALRLLRYPDPLLRRKSELIPAENLRHEDHLNRLRLHAHDLKKLMYLHQAVGIGAIQAGLPMALAVMNGTGDQTRPDREKVLVNPVMIDHSGHTVCEEGCLSLPGVKADVRRFKQVTVEYTDLDTLERKTFTADGLEAVVVQHELQHLQGKLFVDVMGPVSKRVWRKTLRRMEEEYAKQACGAVVSRR